MIYICIIIIILGSFNENYFKLFGKMSEILNFKKIREKVNKNIIISQFNINYFHIILYLKSSISYLNIFPKLSNMLKFAN